MTEAPELAPGPADPSDAAARAERVRRLASGIARRLRAAGHAALFAGGAVRDRLLGAHPQDIDVATSARPEEVQRLFPETVAVGAQFGVVIVVEEGHPFEVATFRSDEAYVDGRRPSGVSFSDPKTDAERRDFTVNGLFEDPETGEVVDHVGGRADLARRLLRAIGDPRARFREDKLRMLRAARFVAQLGFDLDPETAVAMRELAREVSVVSVERIFVELTKTITAPGRVRGLEVLHRTGLLAAVLPEVAALEGVPQPPEFHPEGECWTHQLLVMEHLPPRPDPELAWGALLHDIGKPPTFKVAERIRFDGHAQVGAEMAERLLLRLKAPTRLREAVVELVADHLKYADVPRMKEATLKKFLRNPQIERHLALHEADCRGSHGLLDTHAFCVRRLAEYRAQDAEAALRPRPLLGGKDLIEAGYAPGPIFKRALNALEDAQLEGRVATREEALALVREVLGAPGAAPPA
jgi:poly(A) polymerase